jgi:hypothetical protein
MNTILIFLGGLLLGGILAALLTCWLVYQMGKQIRW